MGPIPASTELSLRRSRVRTRVLIVLASLGEAYASQLARAAGVDVGRLKWILEGHLPQYRPELSLLALGLVERVKTRHGTVYRVTKLGLRKARSLTARRRWSKAERYG